MGIPQAYENRVKHSIRCLLGLLADTTPASSQAKIYGAKKYAVEDGSTPPGTFDNPTRVNVFGPLVNNGFQVQVRAEALQTFIFKATDFINVNGPTTAEVVTALNARLTHVTAALEANGHLSFIDSNSAATTSLIVFSKLPQGYSQYGDALEIFGIPNGATCDITNFRLSCILDTAEREAGIPPIVQAYDWSASTGVATPSVSTQPVISYDPATGILLVTNALAAAHTVAATIVG